MKFYKHLYLLILPIFLLVNCRGTVKGKTLEKESNDTLTFVFAGDVMGHIPQQKAALDKKTGEYNFKDCYQFVKPFIESADFSMANLEIPLAGKPYSGYPMFSAPDELLDGALSAGFDAMELANNHIADKGKKGIIRTYNTVNAKVPSVGVYLRESQRDSLYPLMVDVKGLKVAFLNCTFGTNGNHVPEPCVVNLIDTAQIHKDIKKARQKGAKCVIMTLHWGVEYELKASQEQIELAQFFVNSGVDAIIGSHPHVVQNFEWIKRKDKSSVPVFYSLGNMISNQRWKNSNGGILAKLKISKSTGKVLNASYLPFFVHKGELKGKMKEKFQYYLVPTESYLNEQYDFRLPEKDKEMLTIFEKATKERLNNIQIWEQ